MFGSKVFKDKDIDLSNIRISSSNIREFLTHVSNIRMYTYIYLIYVSMYMLFFCMRRITYISYTIYTAIVTRCVHACVRACVPVCVCMYVLFQQLTFPSRVFLVHHPSLHVQYIYSEREKKQKETRD
jgi:ABC-type siderophore export system fused ATPase/permease subunit